MHKIKKCHHNKWIILEQSKTIWWRNIGLGVEYCEGPSPHSNFVPDTNWNPAQRKKCALCGGIIDEIMYGKAWLALGMNQTPHADDSIVRNGCGDIMDLE